MIGVIGILRTISHNYPLIWLQRTAWSTMDLTPNEVVRGMTQLDRGKFFKMISVPSVLVKSADVGRSLKVLKKYMLKIEKLKSIFDADCEQKRILLDPKIFDSYSALTAAEIESLTNIGVSETSFAKADVNLTYENFRSDDVLKAVLPEGKEGCTSYSRIGHIVHLNLRDHLIPYKGLIGQVLLDKLQGITTVVNKSHVIDTTYRNFEMEILAGDSNLVAEVRENSCLFKFDFSKVYWNPRLCTEHERIIKLLPEKSVLFDVFAGVGPFSLPAAKIRKCRVFANDLNPNSYHWLKENARLNKLGQVETFNKDGRQFIGQDLRGYLLAQQRDSGETAEVHVTMNLPALAVEFLDAFIGLLSDTYETQKEIDITVHVYAFCQESSAFSEMREKVERVLQCGLETRILEIIDVRDVSPKKHMLRMSFRMPACVLHRDYQSEECSAKRPRFDSD
nr:EOG090X08TI [Leptodora kindtii]